WWIRRPSWTRGIPRPAKTFSPPRGRSRAPRSVSRTPVRPAPGPGPGGSGSRWAGPHLCRPPTRPAPPLLPTWERTEPMSALRDAALDYHRRDRPGKLAVVPTKPVSGQNDLALAYTPGVGEAVRAIAARPD